MRNKSQLPLGPGHGQQGMALLITLITLSLLFIVTVQFHRNMWQNYQAARLVQNRQILRAISGSGINLATTVLTRHENEPEADSLFSLWRQLDTKNLLEFANGELHVEIHDEEAKIPINLMDGDIQEEENAKKAQHYQETLHRLLISDAFKMTEEESHALIAATIDWIDKDDETSDDGAEQNYYDSLTPRYRVRNGAITDLSELLSIRGFTPALLYGEAPDKPGLATYLTSAETGGAVNINTATPEVLSYVFPQLNDFLLDNIVEYRKNRDNEDELKSSDWYKNIINWPTEVTLEADLLTVTSTFFTITALATQQQYTYRITATAERLPDGTVQLSNRRTNTTELDNGRTPTGSPY